MFIDLKKENCEVKKIAEKYCKHIVESVKLGELEIKMRGCKLGEEKGYQYAQLNCPNGCYYHWGSEPDALHFCTDKKVVKV